jgi:CBS domain-containing protein
MSATLPPEDSQIDPEDIEGRDAVSRALSSQDPLTTPLSALVRRPPVTCLADEMVNVALGRMRDQNVGSILVVRPDGSPAGMFTLKDLRDRVAIGNCDMKQPMSRVMTPNPFSLDDEQPSFEAALAMAKRSIHHVVITHQGVVRGVISEKDLFALQQVGVARIASHLSIAEDLPTLQRLAEDTRRLARNLMAQGVGAEPLTRLISELNDQLTQRILDLAFSDSGLEDADWCWLALGSEGRFEQTLLTDQDNGLLFLVPEDETADSMRARFLPIAQRVNEWLAACGFPLCHGEVMAMNPKWCLSLEEWQATFGDWIFRGDKPVLLNASIFFDFRALAGDARLAERLRVWLNERVKENRLFLKFMVINALGNRPPLGLVRDFTVDGEGEEANTVDLKINGATLFVDAARIFALGTGANESNTVARLRAAGEIWRLNKDDVEGWVEGFLYIQQARLRLHQSQIVAGKALSNRLNPEDLSVVDRQALKTAFRQAKRLQGKLESFFQF